MIPTSAVAAGTRYTMRTEVKFVPSPEQSVSTEPRLRTTLHQTGPVLARWFIVDQSENLRVKTTQARSP